MSTNNLILNRVETTDNATLGHLYLGNLFLCYTLERKKGQNRPREDRIPEGTYKLGIRDVGGFHNRYKDRFDFHEGMVEITDVPDRTYILFHIGNFWEDTLGCVLVGDSKFISPDDSELAVGNSTETYKKIYPVLLNAAKQNGTLTIIDVEE